MVSVRSVGVALVVGAAVTSGCGGDSVDEGTIADAATATIERGGVAAKGEIVAAGGEGAVIRANGVEDVRAGTAQYDLETEELAETLGGPKPRELDSRVVRRRSVLYATDPFIADLVRQRDATLRWLRLELDSPLIQRFRFDKIAQLMLQSPAHMLRFARVAKAEERVGEEGLDDGLETTHYSGTVSLRAAREAAEEYEEEFLERDTGVMGDDSDGSVDIDAWIDEDGLLRKVLLSYEVEDGPEERTMEISAVGEQVKLRPPDPTQYTSLEEVVRETLRRGE